VISADARQLYRGLDIGTAKPDAVTLARVPHRGLDLLDPGEHYSAGRFARDAAGWIAETRASGRQPMVVGGTGLYIRALARDCFASRRSIRNGARSCAAGPNRWKAAISRGGPAGSTRGFPVEGGSAPHGRWRLRS